MGIVLSHRFDRRRSSFRSAFTVRRVCGDHFSRTWSRASKKPVMSGGYPASMLSDNGAIFTASFRNGVAALEAVLLELGIKFNTLRGPITPRRAARSTASTRP